MALEDSTEHTNHQLPELDQHRRKLLQIYIDSSTIDNPKVNSSLVVAKMVSHLQYLDMVGGYSLIPAMRKLLSNLDEDDLHPSQEIIVYRGFTYNPELRVVTTPYDDPHEDTLLLPIGGRLFHLLIANAGHIVSAGRLIDFAWGVDGGDSDLLKWHISSIRPSIGDRLLTGRKHKHIRVRAKVGYGFFVDHPMEQETDQISLVRGPEEVSSTE